MNVRNYFNYTPNIDLTAAHIGINKWDWTCVSSNNIEEAKLIMKKQRFDILPVSNSCGLVESFYLTNEWNNFDKIKKCSLVDYQHVYYRTSFNDLIRKFSEEQSFFYFLTNNKEMLGLVSIVNLNSHMVYSYLFQLISNIEIKLAASLESCLSLAKVIQIFEISTDKHLIKILEKYKMNVASGSDDSIFSLMYLQTLGILLKKFANELPESLKPILKYRKKFGAGNLYTELRNSIMHPVNTIVNGIDDVVRLYEFLTDYDDMIQILNAE